MYIVVHTVLTRILVLGTEIFDMSREAKDSLFVDMCIYTWNTHTGVYVQYGTPCSDSLVADQ